MRVIVELEQASPEELARGAAAAMRVFEAAGVLPEQAFEAAFAREGWAVRAFDPGAYPGDEVMERAALLDEAEAAAGRACSEGWAQPLDRAPLGLD